MNPVPRLTQATVDLLHDTHTGAMAVRWVHPIAHAARPIRAEDAALLNKQVTELEAQERRDDADASLQIRAQLGRDLFAHLDGPDRLLTALAAQDRKSDEVWALTVRLVDTDDARDACHPAARWPWASLHDGKRYLALEDQIQVAVQLGAIEKPAPRPLARAGVRVLFMAYSPARVLLMTVQNPRG